MPTILVVEDETAIRNMIGLALEEEGDYRVLAARSLGDAEAALAEERPDLVILDAVVPPAASFPGRSGMEFAAYALARELPVIVMTGHPDLADALAEVAFPLLRKPFGIDELLSAVRAAMTRPKDNLRRVRGALAYLLHEPGALAGLIERLGRLGDEIDAAPSNAAPRSPRPRRRQN